MNIPAIPQTLPSEQDIALALESSRALSSVLQTRTDIQKIDFHDDKGILGTVRIPTSALRLLLDILNEVGRGNAVSIIPIQSELTTQEAADILNVSRPFLVQLLEKGEIPFHKIGTHRRVRYQDVITYKESIDAKRRQSLEELAAQAQELDCGY